MALAGITSWEDLAARTPFSRTLLKDLGTQRGVAEERHLRVIAAACDLPYAWFTAPSIKEALAGAEEATLAERVDALESQMQTVIAAVSAARGGATPEGSGGQAAAEAAEEAGRQHRMRRRGPDQGAAPRAGADEAG